MTTRRKKVEVGSGNIFADLGLPDAEDMLLKSTIVIELHLSFRLVHRIVRRHAGVLDRLAGRRVVLCDRQDDRAQQPPVPVGPARG